MSVGRPLLPNNQKKQRSVTLRFTDQEYDDLLNLSKRNKETISASIRNTLKPFFRQQRF